MPSRASPARSPARRLYPLVVSLSNHERVSDPRCYRHSAARPEPVEGRALSRSMTDRRLIAIVGATATGKTSLAVELARRLDGAHPGERPLEIIGADSRQVYRHMDIGTAKPTAGEQAAAPHHLIDVVDPDEPFSLGRWLDLAQAALEDVWSRGGQPLLAGGTGQYVWALLAGWGGPRGPQDPGVRSRMEARATAELFEEG